MNLISIQNISKIFNQTVAVDKLSLDIDQGRLMGLLGTNGAGKSTLLQMIAGLQFPDHGEIVRPYQAVGMRLAFKPSPLTFPNHLTVLEYLFLFAKLTGKQEQLSERDIKLLAQKTHLLTVLNQPLSKLSFGYRERVGFAQVLLVQPDIVLLDEPFQGLDIEHQELAIELIRLMHKEGKTILLCSHQLDKIQALCDYILIMDRGRIIYKEDYSSKGLTRDAEIANLFQFN